LVRLNTAVETLKPPQTGDTRTAFWTAYKTLADEFDKEIQRKYGNDLDTSLIFVRVRAFSFNASESCSNLGGPFFGCQRRVHHPDPT
jgi:hypothetical protein